MFAGLAAAVLTGCGGKTSPETQPATPLSDYATQLLRDNTVTRSEIEDARAQTVQCINADGLSARFVVKDERVSNLEVDSGAPAPGESDDQFEKRFDTTIETCQNEYLNGIDVIWLRTTAPSADERRAAFATFQQCIESYDVIVASSDEQDFGDLFARLDSAETPATERNDMSECFATYSLATATAEG